MTYQPAEHPEAEVTQRRARDLERQAAREHITELNPGGTGKLREWLTRPNGSLTMGRVTFEAVAGGGILVRTQPYWSASQGQDAPASAEG